VDVGVWLRPNTLVHCATSAGNLDLGIYNEALSSKLGSTGAFASPGTGKRTQALTGSVALTAGTVYYLAFWSNNASLLVTTSVLPGAAGFGTWNLVGIQSSVSTNLPASITATWDPGAIAAPIFRDFMMEALAEVGYKELKKNGVFVVPGFAKFVVVKKPATKARMGVNPFRTS